MRKKPTVGVIGGGISGSTIAWRLAECGINVKLFEKGEQIVNGPPMCHLHAGGNLYDELPIEECKLLLKQSIELLQYYPQSVNVRPTIITIPEHYHKSPEELEEKLKVLQAEYQNLIKESIGNKTLGEVSEYYKCYSEKDLRDLYRKRNIVGSIDDWLRPVCKHLDFSTIKFPVFAVQEYGLSLLRLAAMASSAIENMSNCNLLLNTKVINIKRAENTNEWDIFTISDSNPAEVNAVRVNFVINACGFRTGQIDDMLGFRMQRMVEFKSAYLAYWPDSTEKWPEVIFLGKRGTPKGMLQLTPYPGGVFQLHGMTDKISLFNGGLLQSNEHSCQPEIPEQFMEKIKGSWKGNEDVTRTRLAIESIARHFPQFENAVVGGPPLCGAQQIPGVNSELRACDVSFYRANYARIEIVKASSIFGAVAKIVDFIKDEGYSASFLPSDKSITNSFSDSIITKKAEDYARDRGLPITLARIY